MASVRSIEALVDALRDPACYAHPVAAPVQVIETHISFVLIAGEFAYKLKKPLALGFLDFSSLDRRRQCCEDELRLNRRLAPSLYLAVVGIEWDGPSPQVNGPGSVIEYAVQMRAFDQADLLDRRLAAGQLEAAEIDELAQVVAEFHARIECAPAGSDFGSAAAVWLPVRANFVALAPRMRSAATRAALARLARWSRACQRQLEPWFERRRSNGFVRECHGDLHLGNIARVEGAICVFDCIEFSPALRWIDVASEIAFTVMDLADRGRPDLGWRLLDTWLATTGDFESLPGLRFYMVYRALVRAKVTALRLEQTNVATELRLEQTDVATADRPRLQQAQQEYLDLAGELAQARPLLAITHGLSGSGKSHGAQLLLAQLGAVRVRSDVERKRLAGVPALARAPSAPGEALYDRQSTRHTYDRLAASAEQAIAAGIPVIVDAAFLEREWRDRFHALARRFDVPFVVLAFSASEAQLRARIASRERQGSDPSDAGLQVLEYQLARRTALDPDEGAFAITIDAGEGEPALEQSLRAAADELRARIRQRRA